MSTQRLTASNIHILLKNKIFLRRVNAAGVAPNNKALIFDEKSRAEPYVGLYGGLIFPDYIGSFSYTNTTDVRGWNIGRYCSIGRNIILLGVSHPVTRLSSSPFVYQSVRGHEHISAAISDFESEYTWQSNFTEGGGAAPRLGHDVWMGQNVIIKRGVQIGTGAVVAGGAVVVKDVPPYHIVGGNPARVIRQRFPDATVEKLLNSKWWEYKFTDFTGFGTDDPSAFCDRLQEAVAGGKIEPYKPQAMNIAALFNPPEG